MADNIHELIEKRKQLVAEMQSYHDKNENDWNDEHEARWTEYNTDVNALGSQIEERRAAADRRAQIEEMRRASEEAEGTLTRTQREQTADYVVTSEHRALALQAFMRSNRKGVTSAQQDACRRLNFDPTVDEISITLRSPDLSDYPAAWTRDDKAMLQVRMNAFERRAQSVGTDSEGGYLVPEGFSNALERALLAFGGPRQVADVMRTASGNDMPWPTVNDTSNKGRLLAENTAITETAVTFANVVFGAYKYSSDSVLVSQELIEDSAFNLGQVVGSLLGERLARIEAEHFTTGTGSGQPNGVVTASTLGKTAASNAAITSDELYDLQHSVDPAYRQMPGAGWMFNDSTLAAIRKLKDSQNQYLWQEGLTDMQPDRLLGNPYTINQDMASIATVAKTVLYGDFGTYKIRDVADLRLYRLEERYRDNDQTGFIAFHRTDGDLLNAGTNPIKHLVHPV